MTPPTIEERADVVLARLETIADQHEERLDKYSLRLRGVEEKGHRLRSDTDTGKFRTEVLEAALLLYKTDQTKSLEDKLHGLEEVQAREKADKKKHMREAFIRAGILVLGAILTFGATLALQLLGAG